MGVLHQPFFVPLPILVAGAGAFVVLLLPLAQGNFALNLVALPVQGGGHAGVTLLLGGDKNLRQLTRVQQQFAQPLWLGDDMGAGVGQRGDVSTGQVGLALVQGDEGIGELHTPVANAFHFPAHEGDTGFKLVFQKIVVPCPFVLGDGGVAGFFWFSFGFGHGPVSRLWLASELRPVAQKTGAEYSFFVATMGIQVPTIRISHG